MGLATYLHGTIHPLINKVLGVLNIEIFFISGSIVLVLRVRLPPAMDQGKRVGRKILSGL